MIVHVRRCRVDSSTSPPLRVFTPYSPNPYTVKAIHRTHVGLSESVLIAMGELDNSVRQGESGSFDRGRGGRGSRACRALACQKQETRAHESAPRGDGAPTAAASHDATPPRTRHRGGAAVSLSIYGGSGRPSSHCTSRRCNRPSPPSTAGRALADRGAEGELASHTAYP